LNNNDIYNRLIQIEIINSIFDNNCVTAIEDVNIDYIIGEIKKKISSYKQQDIKKNMFNIDKFINIIQVVMSLKLSNLTCHYCKKEVNLIYKEALDKTQWTIDRIDNSIGHNCDNYVIACLKCNLKKGNMNHVKFDFTTNLVINKHTD
jgi:hypothetical protein